MDSMVFLKNLFDLFRYRWLTELNDCQLQVRAQSNRLLYLELMNFADNRFCEELDFLRTIGRAEIFPYPAVRKLETVEIGREGKWGYPYVSHHGKRLYFPKTWTPARMEDTYRIFVEKENITAKSVGDNEGYILKMPHKYQGGCVYVKEGDIIVDVGAAEGLFALDVVERVSRIVLFENDPQWFGPLEHTFAPWADKTFLVRKTVGDRDTRHSIRLASALHDLPGDRFFVKMDIEGAEVPVVSASRDFLSWDKDIRLACCTYHNAGDAEILERLFRETGYFTEFSDGWMLPTARRLSPPYFRKGVIRAWRKHSGQDKTIP